jgi:hypothetical protein
MILIETMYALVAFDDKDGVEGVVAYLDPDTQHWMPLVGADMKRIDGLRNMAQHISNESGKTIHLLEFSKRTLKETFTPNKALKL